VNDLALFFALAGGWLLLATRRRERLALARLAAESEIAPVALDSIEPTARMNRFFYRFGFACMALAVTVSWYSTQL
jgi:hypothetical protein